ncbi:fumarate/nitrate reduction transcriptional regulator Fnr [Thiomicrorhabdus sp.]|uniref:fumarate/nitrate reduction transcriptional regulator Fnr n=1 Tax=Thiomicrorhabdus sp. TaxID=2039724 RepID=UPI0029C687AE|nr:fumarate/nitrate reduction transcriptional regulator Fnr [Thiomicrorhabdus sp.]
MADIKTAFHIGCGNCGLQKICFPTGLVKSDVDRLDTIVDRKPALKKGQHLYQVGDKFQSLFAIRAGVVKLYEITDSGEEVIHGFYLPGDVLGMDGVENKTHQFSASALDSLSICSLPFDQLNDLSLQVPNLHNQILKVMSKEANESRLHTDLLMKKSADQRMAQFIFGMSERYRERGYVYDSFRLAILHRDVALYLGLTPETVSRILAKMHSDGIASWKKKEVQIMDRDALMALAGIIVDRDEKKQKA